MLNSSIKVCHLTSVHPRNDTRVFHKMCKSLNKFGFDTSLIVADGKGNEIIQGIKIYDVGKASGRIKRILFTTFKVFIKAQKLNANLYHFHDPELILAGLLLKIKKKKVIFDSHEDVPKQIFGKYYINFFLRYVFSFLINILEKVACPHFSGIITATPAIEKKFLKINQNVMNINNYPIIDELKSSQSEIKNFFFVTYVGAISSIRGISEIIKSMEHVKINIRLQLAGKFNPTSLLQDMTKYPGWKKVDYLNQISRLELNKLLSNSVAGIVTFHPSPNHLESQPNKLFEYMSAGIPVIASNFPLWKEIVEGNNCGICVDPLNPKAIGEAIQYFIDHPYEQKEMGRNGLKIVHNKYNWAIEEKKFISFYNRVIKLK
jgi:glycosyltransferase involved in cell wall biosynthesis